MYLIKRRFEFNFHRFVLIVLSFYFVSRDCISNFSINGEGNVQFSFVLIIQTSIVYYGITVRNFVFFKETFKFFIIRKSNNFAFHFNYSTGYGQRLSTSCTSPSKKFFSTLSFHFRSKTMLSSSFNFRWLVCSFHRIR